MRAYLAGALLVPELPVAPVAPVAPVEPVEPVEPVLPVDPVEPVAPVAPVAPVEPVAPVVGGTTTVFVLSQALRPTVANSAAKSIEYFMVNLLSNEKKTRKEQPTELC